METEGSLPHSQVFSLLIGVNNINGVTEEETHYRILMRTDWQK